MTLRSFASAAFVTVLAGIAAAQQPRLGMTVEEGRNEIRVVEVVPDSPAAAAGVEVGDVLVRLDGTEIRNDLDAFKRAMDGRKPGDELKIVVRRDGETKSLTAKLDRAKAPDPEPERRAPRMRGARPPRPETPAPESAKKSPFLGVETEPGEDGLTITHVVPGTAAARAGLREGDVILEADGHEVESRHELIERVQARKPGDPFVVEVKRGDTTMKVEAKLGERSGAEAMPAPEAPAVPPVVAAPRVQGVEVAELRAEVAALRAELAKLREELAAVKKKAGK